MEETIKKLLAPSKGILAADESEHTAQKRLASVGLESTPENRRRFRDLFLSAPGVEQYLSGVILYDETIRQNANDGTPFAKLLTNKGIVPGIKVDQGLVENNLFPGEKITKGLEGLPERLQEYYALGARFAKWRAVAVIDELTPTEGAIKADAKRMAEYAKYCQAQDIVPIVEPEVLISGPHNIDISEKVTEMVLSLVFEVLKDREVDLTKVILKSSMVVPGDMSGQIATPAEVGRRTVEVLKKSVPAEVPGIVFLSGGQKPHEATENLNAIAKLEPLPWQIAFSFARAIQQPVLDAWGGKAENVEVARRVLIQTLAENRKADQGKLD